MLPIKAANGDSAQRAGLHSIQRHRIPIWVGTRPVKGGDTTFAAEEVPCNASVEPVLAEGVCPTGDVEARGGDDDVRVALK